MSGAAIPFRSNAHRLLGDLPEYRKDPLGFWLGLGRQAPVVKIRFGPTARHVVSDPDFAQHILQQNHQNYTKDQRLKKILEAGTGPVLATSDGEAWRSRRKLMQPTFKRPAIAHFADEIVEHTERMTAGWAPGDTIDIAEAMKTLTMNIIGQTMFSVDFTASSAELHHAYAQFGRGLVRRATQLLPVPVWAPTRQNREFRQSIAIIRRFLKAVLAERRRSQVATSDLMDMLLTHRLEEGGAWEDDFIHEMSAIVFAGHETTATALSWVFCLLAQHPAVQEKVIAEGEGLGARAPGADDVKAMPYLQQVIDETLRLYPPLYINSRQAIGDDALGPYSLRAGSRVLINIVGIHRNEVHWPQPDRFDPDRFAPEPKSARHSFAHIPFLKGPRTCIGSALAMLELQIVVPLILQRWSLSLEHPVAAEAGVVLQPRGGLPMRLARR